MGPVSFQRVGEFSDRAELVAAARRLTDVGIRVEVTGGLADDAGSLLVRAEDAVRARSILDSARAEDER